MSSSVSAPIPWLCLPSFISVSSGRIRGVSLPIAARFQIVQGYRHEKNPYGLQLTDFDFIAYPRGNGNRKPQKENQ